MEQLKPAEVAERLGISVKTLQRWDNEGIFMARRTATGRRCYTEQQIKEYMASQNKFDHEHTSDLTVFYVFRGDTSKHELLNSLISNKTAQKKLGICYSKSKDSFLGQKNHIDSFIQDAGFVIEDMDRDEVSDEEYEKEISIYKNSLVDYLACDWEGYDLTLSYGVNKYDTISLPLDDQIENALDAIVSFDWLLNADDWYSDITKNTKKVMLNMVIANLRRSLQEELNPKNESEN